VADDVREYLALFYPQVCYGGESFGGTRTTSPFTDAQIDEFARTYGRPQVLHGGFELYRTVAQDERDNTAAAAITMPTMLMTAQGSLSSFRPLVAGRRGNRTRAGGGAPTAELLAFLAGQLAPSPRHDRRTT